MTSVARFIALPMAMLLASCYPSPQSIPAPNDANTRTVLDFMSAYGRRDLDGMMKYLDEDAVFRGTGAVLSKLQIREFFLASFKKHPKLRVEVGSLKTVQGSIYASVKVETESIWADTWIFEMKNHKIHSYSLASGSR